MDTDLASIGGFTHPVVKRDSKKWPHFVDGKRELQDGKDSRMVKNYWNPQLTPSQTKPS